MVVVDWGGTKARAGLVELSGAGSVRMIAEETLTFSETDKRGAPEPVFDLIARAVGRVARAQGVAVAPLAFIYSYPARLERIDRAVALASTSPSRQPAGPPSTSNLAIVRAPRTVPSTAMSSDLSPRAPSRSEPARRKGTSFSSRAVRDFSVSPAARSSPANKPASAAELDAAITDRTTVVSIMLANNEVGTLQPIADIAARVRNHKGVVFHVDAVQAAPYLAVDVRTLGADLLSLGAHKFEGPKGVGVLWVKHGTHILAQQQGGSQERHRRAGTEDVAGAVGLATAYHLTCEGRAETATRLATQREARGGPLP